MPSQSAPLAHGHTPRVLRVQDVRVFAAVEIQVALTTLTVISASFYLCCNLLGFRYYMYQGKFLYSYKDVRELSMIIF